MGNCRCHCFPLLIIFAEDKPWRLKHFATKVLSNTFLLREMGGWKTNNRVTWPKWPSIFSIFQGKHFQFKFGRVGFQQCSFKNATAQYHILSKMGLVSFTSYLLNLTDHDVWRCNFQGRGLIENFRTVFWTINRRTSWENFSDFPEDFNGVITRNSR